ncbi:hypothetical protein NPIL_596611 [Nephila pilipes]|uniref:Uncharacterized protein n=1 Tax=Nephila pilipes TaxID=299642 RepID=A0A8X6Q3W2_NEPPI|nr:hypothetical protein NPIL_596611 [Nephila pilipes]
MSFYREVCLDMCVFESTMLGHPGETASIGENMFGKRKYYRGKRVHGYGCLEECKGALIVVFPALYMTYLKINFCNPDIEI